MLASLPAGAARKEMALPPTSAAAAGAAGVAAGAARKEMALPPASAAAAGAAGVAAAAPPHRNSARAGIWDQRVGVHGR